jgi:hypothetical protein
MSNPVIQRYEEDEQVMIQLYVQWCVNHEIDAKVLYEHAYPSQIDNIALLKALDEVEKDSLHVDTETVLHVLQLFGNDDLAFAVSEAAIHIK